MKVTKEQLEVLEKGAASIGKSAIEGVNALTAEAINLFIVQSAMHVLKFASVFIVFYMVKKYLEFLQESGLAVTKVRAVKLFSLIVSIMFFTTQSFPHLLNMTEALVAPNVFLVKKGAEFYKEVK